jgi:hypothetical protein
MNMPVHRATVVLVHKTENDESSDRNDPDYTPLQEVEVYMVFTNTDKEAVQDWLLRQQVEHPTWEFSMASSSTTGLVDDLVQP